MNPGTPLFLIVENYRSFLAREWARTHMSCERASSGPILSEESQKQRGTPWTENLIVKVNGLECGGSLAL
jgi:hypothetical protein